MTKLFLWTVMCVSLCASGSIASAASPDRQVVAFIIDSSAGMLPRQREQFQLFPEITHGDVVRQLLWESGSPDELLFRDVDDEQGHIDNDQYLAALAEAETYSLQHPSHRLVVNLSLGSEAPDREERRRIEQLLGRGVVIVAAAGNESGDHAYYPAAYPGVIAVAAADCRNKPSTRLADYSNRGPEIDILADGFYRRTDVVPMLSNVFTNRFSATGTSFATPRVAGTAVRMLRLSDLTAAEIQQILRDTGRPLDSGERRKNGRIGGGFLYPHAALSRVRPGYWTFWLRAAVLIGGVLWAFRCLARSGCSNVLLCLVTLSLCAGFFFGLDPLLRQAHAVPLEDRPPWLADPLALDLSVVVATLLLVAFPVTLPTFARRWRERRLQAALVRDATSMAIRGDLQSLRRKLESRERTEIAATIRGISRSGEDCSSLFAGWLVDGGNRHLRSHTVALQLTDYGVRYPLKPALRSYLVCDREELLDIPRCLSADHDIEPESDTPILRADELGSLDATALRDALTDIAADHERKLVCRIPGVRRRIAAAVALRRLGWSHDEDVQRALGQLQATDPFFPSIDRAIQGIGQEAYEPDVEPIFENRRVMFVTVVLALGAIAGLAFALTRL